MHDIRSRDLSRREFLKTSAGARRRRWRWAALAARLAHARRTKTLDMWWWGEQELPGLQAFVDSSVAGYTDATVKPMLQDTAVVISQFQTAAAAGNAPDIQYLWNGIYHMESVWLGYLQAARRPGERRCDRRPRSPTLLSHFGGNTYRVGWYPLPMIWIYNKDLFEKAGLDPRSAAEDLGRSPRRLREAEDRRHRAARRRHPGRLLGRMVLRPCAARRTSTRSAKRSSSSPATRISAIRSITSTG